MGDTEYYTALMQALAAKKLADAVPGSSVDYGDLSAAAIAALNGTYALNSQGRLGNRWAFLGDSLMVGGWSGSLHSDTWPTYFAMLSRGKVQIVTNAGVSGNTTAQMLARMQTDVIARAPQVCAVGGGTNDIGQSVPLATFQANIRGIVETLRAASIQPVLVTMPPSDTVSATTSTWNQWIRRYAAQQQIPLLDIYPALVDPSNGRYAAGVSPDGVHPGAAGYYTIGALANTVLGPVLSPAAITLGTDAGDTNNLAPGCMFLTDGGSGVGSHWAAIRNGSGTRAYSLVTDSSIVGKWQQVVTSAWTNGNADGSGDCGVGYYNASPGSAYAVGDRLALAGLISVPALANGTTYRVEINLGGAGQLPAVSSLTQTISGIAAFYYETTVIAGGTSSYEIDVYLHNTAGQTSGTLKVAQVGLYNLTKLGLV